MCVILGLHTEKCLTGDKCYHLEMSDAIVLYATSFVNCLTIKNKKVILHQQI